jgi:transposase InsO family protein
MIFLDWYTEKVARWVVELRSRVEDWKRILEMAIEREFSYGVRGEGLKFISGHGS